LVVKRSQPLGGIATVTLVAGDGTEAVTFSPDLDFDNAPLVLVSFAESPGAGKRGFVTAENITVFGFDITVDSDIAGGTIDVSWIAIRKRSSEEAD